MDLRQIGYVQAIARVSNFTRAAEDLHVAQPALSTAIRNLEGELGLRLFERSSRGVSLTDAGRAFLARSQRISSEVTLLQEEMSEYAGGLRGSVHASCWYHIYPPTLDFLRDYTAANPGVDLSIVELPSPQALKSVRVGDLDLAVIVITDGLDLSGVELSVGHSEPYVLAVDPHHRLASRDSVCLTDIACERYVVSAPGTAFRRLFDAAFAGVEQMPRMAIETNEIAAAVTYVSLGLGVAMLTPSIVRQLNVPVALVPIRDLRPFVAAVAWKPGEHGKAVSGAISLASRIAAASRREGA